MGLFLENKEPSLRKEAREAMPFLKEAKLVGRTNLTPAPLCDRCHTHSLRHVTRADVRQPCRATVSALLGLISMHVIADMYNTCVRPTFHHLSDYLSCYLGNWLSRDHYKRNNFFHGIRVFLMNCPLLWHVMGIARRS